MGQTIRWSIKRLPLLIAPLIFACLGLVLQPPEHAFAQDTGQISGTIYHDMSGEAITSTFTLFETPAKVSLFRNSTYITTTVTDASGHYTFTGLSGSSGGTLYFVTVDNPNELAGYTDTDGSGIVDQTYGSAGNSPKSTDGPVCAGRLEYAQQSGTSTGSWRGEAQNDDDLKGPCYGGRDATMAFIDVSNSTVIAERRYMTRLSIKTGATVSGVDFAFSHNVVTNLEETGSGSLRMFLRAANAISGTNVMRFIPVVAPNMDMGAGKEWWRLPMTSTVQLPAITGDDTVIDGYTYYYRDGSQSDTNTGIIFDNTTVGTMDHTIASLERPELEILEKLSFNEATMDVQANDVTIRRLAFNVSENFAGAAYHIRQSAGISLTVEDVSMGYDMDTNGAATQRSLYGIQSAYASPTTGSGTFRHNYIASNQTSILLSNSTSDPGNVVAATLGDWTIEENILTGGIRLGAGTERILIRYNHSDEALIMAQSPGVNTAVGTNTIIGNSFTSNSGDTLRLYDADNNTITYNKLHNGSGSGVSISSGGIGNRVSQNSFQSNQGNAIDLGDNGVTEDTSCSGAGGANGGLGRPEITNAKLGGNVLTASGTYCDSGTFDIEFYKAHVSAGEGVPEAGEGSVYLGKLAGLSGGSFANETVTIPVTASLQVGDKVTALLIDTGNGNTSEFSANYDLSLVISGKVFHDTDGLAATDGPAFVGSTTADLHLYDYLGVHLTKVELDENGTFSFGGLDNGTYYVALNDFRGLATGDAGDGSLQVEQTYGSAGDGKAGSGPICVGPAPTYTQQSLSSPATWSAGAQDGTALAGPCYGGRTSGPSTYVNSNTPPVGSSEHVIRIVVQDNDVTNVAFGFSANVVTNLGTDFTQGTLASYIKLANTLAGSNAMRFVPVENPNRSSGGDKWWRISVPSLLPQITADDTSISGVAYSNTDGTTILDTNTITVGTTSMVGLGADGRADTGDEPQIVGMSAPELEVIPTADVAYGFDVNASNITIQHLAIYGFGSATLPTGATNFGETGNIVLQDGVDNVTITKNMLGTGAGAFTDPGSSRTKGSNLIFAGGASNVTISNNLIGFAGDSGLLKYAKSGKAPLTNSTITENEIRGNGIAPATNMQGAGMELNNATLPGSGQGLAIRNNLVIANAAQGLQVDYGRGVTIEDNTFDGNGASGTVSLDERQNIQFAGGESTTVEHNSITGSVASDGIELRNGTGAGATPANQVRITENQFGSNRGQAINLVPDGVNQNNNNCAESSQQNMLVDYPVITLAEIDGTTLKINGSSCAGLSGTVEIYKVAANSGQGETVSSDIYGEGGTFLGSFAVTGGDFGNQLLNGIQNLIAGEYVTALFIDANGNTSEFSQNAYVYTPVMLAVTPSVTEGISGTIMATINITSLNPINVTLGFTNNTAADNDYTAGTAITIPAGQLGASIPFTATQDTTVEDAETFTVDITDADNATIGATPQSVTILDDDVTSVTLAATPTLVEGESGLITATLATLSVNPVQLTLVYTNVETSGDDYTASTTLIIPGSQQSASISFQANADSEIEDTETLLVDIASAQGATSAATAQTITILNDTDGDLVADVNDEDDDGDGIADDIEGTDDPDADGKGNSLDTDSDNDNIPDAIEGHDANGDGVPDHPFANTDNDNDGLDDAFDDDFGGQDPSQPDADSDTLPNYLDNDDDDDTKLTNTEDANGDGDNNPATNPTDGDGDQIPDYLDPADNPGASNGGDSDNDGIMDAFEFDADGNGSGPDNTDGDGMPDYLDPDDDNDSIDTINEFADPNNDGNPADAVDTDVDGTPNYRDNDDDNDGKDTATEGDSTDADGDQILDYLDPDDTTVGQNGGDSDNDGIRDAFELDADGDTVKPDDTDGDGLVNYLDNDDDGDGLPTLNENADPDGNGNPDDALNSDTDTTPDYLDEDSDKDGLADGAEFQLGDTDLDSKPNYRDDDDDNDGILTKDEQPDPNGDKQPDDAVDHDGDGKPDYLDKDDDNDGKDTVAEGATTDADGDGIKDYLDPVDDPANANGGDSDGDGVSDAFEFDADGNAQGPDDTDGDNRANYWDNDDDNDTIPTNQEQADPNGDGNPTDALNTDGDALPNYLDDDDDNDTKLTSSEGANADADADRIVDYLDPVDNPANANGGDSDGDGIRDAFEFDVTGDNQGPDDSNGDGQADYMDNDDDGDGALTGAENADPNGDGNPADAKDTDGDTTPDYLDTNNLDGLAADNDQDGITTGNEDVNQDGNIHNDDTDSDTVPNYLDNDDDGDGIPTKDESGDTDSDGIPNHLDNDDDGDGIPTKDESGDTDGDNTPNHLDADDDGDGVLTKDETGNGDTDGDNLPNHLDADDDGDGILSKDEDANGDGNLTNDDADQDGTPDYLDTDSTLDSDGDGTPDNVDPDDDNDGVSDVDEGSGQVDTDGDGTPDVFDTDDDNDTVLTKDENAEAGNLPVVRTLAGSTLPDTDADGTPNYRDIDDDGDGLLTKDELAFNDTDGDQIRNYLDTDDDGDGIPTKSDNTGLDPADTDPTDDDTDGDGTPNYLDADDDGDGIPTKNEDVNGDGDPTNDDSDKDGKADAIDEDDDNDGILTKDEDPTADTDGDGIPDYRDTNTTVEPETFQLMLPIVHR